MSAAGEAMDKWKSEQKAKSRELIREPFDMDELFKTAHREVFTDSEGEPDSEEVLMHLKSELKRALRLASIDPELIRNVSFHIAGHPECRWSRDTGFVDQDEMHEADYLSSLTLHIDGHHDHSFNTNRYQLTHLEGQTGMMVQEDETRAPESDRAEARRVSEGVEAKVAAKLGLRSSKDSESSGSDSESGDEDKCMESEETVEALRQRFVYGVSTDYEEFTFIEGNRLVSDQHVKNLEKSIKKQGIQNPISVYRGGDDDKLVILDGQHRFRSLKNMNRAVPYLEDTSEDVIERHERIRQIADLNNNNKSWRAADYLRAYAELGDESYIWLKELLEQAVDTSYSLSAIIGTSAFPQGSTSDRKTWFNEGALDMSDDDKDRTESFLNFMERVREIVDTQPESKFRWMSSAMKGIYPLWKHDDFDEDHFFMKVTESPLQKRRSIDDFRKQFVAKYNLDLSSKNKIDLDSD